MVFGQELAPGKVGMISGMFFGFSFGMGGLGAAFLGWLADRTGIEWVYQVCAYLPAIGLLAAFPAPGGAASAAGLIWRLSPVVETAESLIVPLDPTSGRTFPYV